jgi:hypothetical protein
MWKEVVVIKFEVCPKNFLQELKKPTNSDSEWPVFRLRFNWKPSTYK